MNTIKKIPCIMAVDVGGTSTKVALYEEELSKEQKPNLIKYIEGPTGSPAVTKDAKKNITDTINNLLSNIDPIYEMKFIQMGISGIGTVLDVSKWEEYFQTIFVVPCKIDSDAAAALYSLIENKYPNGVVALSGTGSSAAGVKNNQYHMVGGFGNLIRERGSAYAIVHQLSLTIIEKEEIKEPLTLLEKGLLKEIGIKDGFGFKAVYFNNTKTYIASFATYIEQMAKKGNQQAIEVIEEEGRQLAYHVEKIVKAIGLEEEDWLGLYGSCIRKNEIMKKAFFDYLDKKGIKLKYQFDLDDLITGVFYHGVKNYNLLRR